MRYSMGLCGGDGGVWIDLRRPVFQGERDSAGGGLATEGFACERIPRGSKVDGGDGGMVKLGRGHDGEAVGAAEIEGSGGVWLAEVEFGTREAGEELDE